MQELHAWYDSGRMSAQQAFWFEPRPEEELYDLAVDPHEVNNLAGDPAYADVLDRMRGALAAWRARVPDSSDEPEDAMAERFWPGGEQPVTAVPAIEVENGRVTLRCATEGASIGYRLGDGAWTLYTGPFDIARGVELRARAVRYGWRESAEAVAAAPAGGES